MTAASEMANAQPLQPNPPHPVWDPKTRRETAGRLNLAVRRLRVFENERHWTQTLAWATEGFAERAAVFIVNADRLELRAARNLNANALGPVPLASAPAFANAVESLDTLIAMRTRGELSPAIAQLTGEAPEARCALFPLVTRGRAAAVLYADGLLESSALELLASFAGAVLDGLTPRTPANLLEIVPGDAPLA